MASEVGQPLSRVDGPLKVSGGARYAAEIPVNGVAYGVLVQSAIANGRIRALDTAAAEHAPGVFAVMTYLNAPRVARPKRLPSGDSVPILQGPDIHFAGENVACVVADSLERAEHAAALVRVIYDREAPVADMDAHLADAFDPQALSGGQKPVTARGDVDAGLATAVTRLDETYITPVFHHNAMEPHATIAIWDGENLLLYNATQNVDGNQKAVASAFGMKPENVRVINRFVGGGFGSKGMTWPHTVVAAMAAKLVGRPVKLCLTREQMYTSNGHRPRTVQKITMGADASGQLTALRHDTTSHTSILDDFVEPCGLLSQMLYSCPHVEVSHRLVRLNVGSPTFMRAPGEASGSFGLESAMDELAYAVKLDPLELRLRNYAETDEQQDKPFSSKSLRMCYHMGAEQFGWDKRAPAVRSMRDGRWLVGYGMATASYPANFRGGSASATMGANGYAVIKTASHDLGTGTYTILTQIASDGLGLAPQFIRVEIADTWLPDAPGAGGSTSAASVGTAVQAACAALKAKLVALAVGDSKSPLFGRDPSGIVAAGGRLLDSSRPAAGETLVALVARQPQKQVQANVSVQSRSGRQSPSGQGGGGQGGGAPAPNSPGAGQVGGAAQGSKGDPATVEHTAKDEVSAHSYHGFGAHFVEVRVDSDLGIVRVSRAVGVFANGRVLNAKTARSQMIGGMTMGFGMALMEGTHLDTNYGRFTNADLSGYLVPVNADIPDIEVSFVEEEDPFVNPIGVKGMGEIGIVGAAAAVANAVYHATGVRVRELPITLEKLL